MTATTTIKTDHELRDKMICELLAYINNDPAFLDRNPTMDERDKLAGYSYVNIIRPLVIRDINNGSTLQQCATKYAITKAQVRRIKEAYMNF